jgi:hypothetical protein
MIQCRLSLALVVSAVSVLASSPVAAQSLPDSVLIAVRSGVRAIDLRSDSAVVPLVGAPTLPLVQVWINGEGPYRMLVDLGANVSLLRRNVVDAARAIVLVDRPTSDIVRVATLRLGALELQDVTLAAYDELDVDGVLGYNVLQHASFTLDFPGQSLVFHRRALPLPDGRTIHPYVLHGRLPYLVARVGSDSLLLNLDTGAAEVMTVPSALESRLRWQAPPTAGRATFNNQTGRTVVREGRLADTVRVGHFTLAQPLVFINPDAEDAWLGAASMNRGRWTFDPRQRRLQIELP